MRLTIAFLLLACVGLTSACDGLSRSESECGSEQAQEQVGDLLRQELEYGVQNSLNASYELGSFSTAELETAVNRLQFAVSEVRTTRDDPDSQRLSCRATLSITIPDGVESRANEARTMVDARTVDSLANVYRMTARGGAYNTDFEYFIQPTDDGERLFAEIDSESPTLEFLTEIYASYLMIDEIRQARIEQDQAAAAELAAEREIEEANEARATASLNSARVARQLASERISAVWQGMPRGAQLDLDDLHGAWVREMNARCDVEAAGSDPSAVMREARKLTCQTRHVRSCATTLERNTNSRASTWSYCRF